MTTEEKKKIISIPLDIEVGDLMELIFVLRSDNSYMSRRVLSCIEDALS